MALRGSIKAAPSLPVRSPGVAAAVFSILPSQASLFRRDSR